MYKQYNNDEPDIQDEETADSILTDDDSININTESKQSEGITTNVNGSKITTNNVDTV